MQIIVKVSKICIISNVNVNPFPFVQNLAGAKLPLTIEANDTTLAVKQMLQEKEGIEIDQIRLIFGGKQLADENTLEAAGIKAGAQIHMVLQL